ncbi:hypothetical protein AB9F45_36150, partial [Rhizobium leguminosarum]
MTASAENGKSVQAMRKPPVVSPQAWESAREQLLVKEKAETRAREYFYRDCCYDCHWRPAGMGRSFASGGQGRRYRPR